MDQGGLVLAEQEVVDGAGLERALDGLAQREVLVVGHAEEGVEVARPVTQFLLGRGRRRRCG